MVSVPVGIEEHRPIQMSASPNPVRHVLHVDFVESFVGQMVLRDGVGRVVDQAQMAGKSMDWPLSMHPSGVYTLHALERAGGASVMRLMIVH